MSMKSDWDILDLDEDGDWYHFQILERLNSQGVECLFADIWTDNNIAFLIGCNERDGKIADVLGIHRECVYNDFEHSFVILNLFQEKCLRNGKE